MVKDNLNIIVRHLEITSRGRSVPFHSPSSELRVGQSRLGEAHFPPEAVHTRVLEYLAMLMTLSYSQSTPDTSTFIVYRSVKPRMRS